MSRPRRPPTNVEYTYVALVVRCPRGHVAGKVVRDEGSVMWDSPLRVVERDGTELDCWGMSSQPPTGDAKLRSVCPVCKADSQLRWERVIAALDERHTTATGHRDTLQMP